MDIPRVIIIASIVAVLYALLINWNEFSAEQLATTSSETTSSQDINTDIPDANNLPKANHSDLPQVNTTEEATPNAIAKNINTKLINVKTDVLDLNIDLVGGNIVSSKLLKHLKTLDKGSDPYIILNQNKNHLYIAQSGLVGPNGTNTQKSPNPLYSASQNTYSLANDRDTLTIDLALANPQPNVTITKRYTLTRGSYEIAVNYIVDNQSNENWQASFYAQLKRDSNKPESAQSTGLGMQPFLGVASRTDEKRFTKMDFKKIQDKPFENEGKNKWIAIIQHYFLTAWIPNKEQNYKYNAFTNNAGFNIARATGPLITIAPNETKTFTSTLYTGPKDQYKLKEISDGLDLSVDYSWLWWVAQPLFWLLTFFHKIVSNWGWAIVLLTVLVKAIFFIPSAKAYKSMAAMRKIQPKLVELRERYGDDRQKQSQEMMALYRKEGVNPIGGCLPMLIQMPVFLALYWVLMESVELRHAPFIGYIKDLSAPDPYFIMPIIMGVSMYLQQKLNPQPADPMQAKIMQFMPIGFTIFFLWFPAGLVLYWVVNNILSIIQQWFITKKMMSTS